MKKQMITLAMTMLIGTTSVFGDATSVQAAENNLVLDGSQMTEEVDKLEGLEVGGDDYI